MKKIVTKLLTIFTILAVTVFFNNSGSYAITAASSQLYEGIDVSDWQGYIDYRQVRESGIEIVYIKSSQGSNIRDPYFDINYENAKANGLKVGFYHFLTATNTRRSRARSNFFCFSDIGKNTRL